MVAQPSVLIAGVLTATGVGFGAFVLVITASARYEESTTTLFSGVVGGLYLLAGLIARVRCPGNAVGLVMVLVGIGWFAEDMQISVSPIVHTTVGLGHHGGVQELRAAGLVGAVQPLMLMDHVIRFEGHSGVSGLRVRGHAGAVA
jgi:hypothetical protein